MEKETPRRDLLVELGLEDLTIFENPSYDKAIIGYNDADSRIIYDYEKMAECLMEEDGMTYEEAIEFIDYNTIRAIPYFPNGPIVMHGIDDYMDYNIPEYNFDAKKIKEKLVQWIKDWFEENGNGCNAVIGLSGGKDSTIAAALCAEALGKDRVIGVAMPDNGQDINEADKIAEYLGIRFLECDISDITKSIRNVWINENDVCCLSEQAEQNIPPRVRMTMLYAIAQTYNGRPSCNCNLSEDYVGYATFGGDDLGAFAPLAKLTVTEIKAIGHELGLPAKWVDKVPDDGLPHSSSDEEKFGFTYDFLDRYIRTGCYDDDEKWGKIVKMHNKNIFKTQIIRVPSYDPHLPIHV